MVFDSGGRVLLVNEPLLLCMCHLWQLHLHQAITDKLSHASYIRYGTTNKKILKDFSGPLEKKKKRETFKEIQVVKTLPYEKVSRPTGISPASNGLGVTMSASLYCILLSLFSLFPFSTHCLFFSVCCFSHKYPHQCVSSKSIPTFHFPTCCIIVTPLHTNLQVASFQSANVRSSDRPRKLVQASGVHCHERASSTSGCALCTQLSGAA